MTWPVSLVDPFRNDAEGHKIQSHGKGVEPVRLSIWHNFFAADFPAHCPDLADHWRGGETVIPGEHGLTVKSDAC